MGSYTKPLSTNDVLKISSVYQNGWYSANVSTTALESGGVFGASVTATDSSSAADLDEYGKYFEQATTAVAGNDAGNFTTNDTTGLLLAPLFDFALQPRTLVTSLRTFVGLTDRSSVSAQGGNDDPNGRYVGFHFSTNRGDTNWQFVEDNNSTQTLTDSGVKMTADTFYRMRLDVAVGGLSVQATIYDEIGAIQSQATLNTTLPATTTEIRPMLQFETLTSVARSMRTYKCALVNRGYKV